MGQHQRKLAQVSTTMEAAGETATSEARSEVVLVPHKQQIKFLNQQLLAPRKRQGKRCFIKHTNSSVVCLNGAAVNTSLVSQPATTTDSDLQVKGLCLQGRTVGINFKVCQRLNFM